MDEEKQAAFDKIIESDVLRVHHMDFEYLLLYVLQTPWMKANRDLSLDISQAAGMKDIEAEMHYWLTIVKNRSSARYQDWYER